MMKNIHFKAFLVSFLIIFSRRPDAITNPQFWAEDGLVFYRQAYNNGAISSLLSTHAGYLHLVPRLTAAFSILFPLKAAPLIFNLVAIIIQILPVVFLLSLRFSKLIPNINYRIFISFLYLGLPGCYEVNANLTNAQWHIALLLFMVFIAPSSHATGKILDIIIIFIGGLTGPFSIILIPVIIFIIFFTKNKNRIKSKPINLIPFFILLFTALIQIIVLANDKVGQKRVSQLGSNFLDLNTLTTLLKIITNQIFSMSIFGSNTTQYLVKTVPQDLYLFWSIIVSIIGIITLIYLLIKSPLELKSLIIFSGLIPFAALVSELPNIAPFELVGFGGRYWFNLVLAFSIGIIWFCTKIYNNTKSFITKLYVVSIIIVMFTGILNDWQHPPYTDFKFIDYADKFTELSVGSEMIIPINPNLSMKLVKN